MDRNTAWGGPGQEPGVQYLGPHYPQFQQHPQSPHQARLIAGYQQPQPNVHYGPPQQQYQVIRPHVQQWQPGHGPDDQLRHQYEYAYASGQNFAHDSLAEKKKNQAH
jgi:hypothetical protein